MQSYTKKQARRYGDKAEIKYVASAVLSKAE